jgi:hypothetical protein
MLSESVDHFGIPLIESKQRYFHCTTEEKAKKIMHGGYTFPTQDLWIL